MSRGGRWRLTTKLSVLMGLLAASVAVVANPASATAMPSTPTNVTVTAGDEEATVSWSAGGTGDGGSCTTDEYFVTIYDATQQSFPVVAESLPITSGTSWFVDELSPAKRHYVTVEAYGDGFGEDCDDETSRGLGTAFFTTNASTSTSDPSAPTMRKLRTPLPVRDLSASLNRLNGELTITWTKPRDIGSKRNKRCPYTHQASDSHASGYIEYNYMIENLTTGADLTDEYFRSNSSSLSKTFTGVLANGRGNYIRVTVSAYSSVCDFWSKVRSYSFWT